MTVHHETHPFHPPTLELKGYVPDTLGLGEMLVRFSVVLVVVVGVGRGVLLKVAGKSGKRNVGKTMEGKEIGRKRKEMAPIGWGEEMLIWWFLLCGFLHLFFEGYFVFNHREMPAKNDFFGQLWKEYALSDSRYMSVDPLVLCMEALTMIIWGPLSLLTAYLIATSSPYRHPIQALVSAGHLYGCLIYYTTVFAEELYKGISYCRPEAYYFYGYFLMFNAPWIVVPSLCLWSSIHKSAEAFSIASAARLQVQNREKDS